MVTEGSKDSKENTNLLADFIMKEGNDLSVIMFSKVLRQRNTHNATLHLFLSNAENSSFLVSWRRKIFYKIIFVVKFSMFRLFIRSTF